MEAINFFDKSINQFENSFASFSYHELAKKFLCDLRILLRNEIISRMLFDYRGYIDLSHRVYLASHINVCTSFLKCAWAAVGI